MWVSVSGIFCVCVGLVFYFIYGLGSFVVWLEVRNGLNGRMDCVCCLVVIISGVWFLKVVKILFMVLLILVVECRFISVVLFVVCVKLFVMLIIMVFCKFRM